MLKYGLIFILSISFSADVSARIRNRKVKEAPKVCKLMAEDVMLTRGGKKVYGTLRHSLVFEKTENQQIVSLVKDKGEKICEWHSEQWDQILKNNAVENLMGFKYHIDEYKEILYPYVQKADGSYFIMTVPFAGFSLENQITKIKLDLPKCEIPKKAKKRRAAKSTAKNTAKKKTK